MSERIIRVCCAVIIENGRLLAARRGMNMDLPLKWELPGGKLEGGESAEEAVVRELEEELGIETKAEEVLKSVIHHYPDKTIELIPVVVRIISGEPLALDHHEISWIETGSLETPDWADADRALLEANNMIKNRINIDFSRNNLDKALSPYLRQHSKNPVFWQEWSSDVLVHAKETGKILFVSVGYSTCHWCHVMASEAFSDPVCSDYLNSYFISVKIDREERPDIDRYLMSFLTSSTGSGGWPLNAFLSPDLKPFFAMTYASTGPRHNMPGFYEILRQIKAFYDKNNTGFSEFKPVYGIQKIEEKEASHIDKALLAQADFNPDAQTEFEGPGGFGTGQKFPPHSSMLYLLYRVAGLKETEDNHDTENNVIYTHIRKITGKTLDSMCLKGLHDHLQGGFYRYCVDRYWTIPHFEKMLYDQAMLLWEYSLSFRIFKEPLYKNCAEGIFRCLQETFFDNGLFSAAFDADTDHREGGTYLWTFEELESSLSIDEINALSCAYYLPPEGNFEGKIHLIKKEQYRDYYCLDDLLSAEEKLLAARKKRPQPFCDTKKITSWNSLAGIALLQMYRHLGNHDALNTALDIRDKLLGAHINGVGTVLRGSLDGLSLTGKFLEDHAALLLFLTYCFEEDRKYKDVIENLYTGLTVFRDGDSWFGSRESDFLPVRAEQFDLPIPAESTLADFASVRAAMVLGKNYSQMPFGMPGVQDFQNFAALETGVYSYFIKSPSPVPWEKLPVHAIQTNGDDIEYCHNGTCTRGLPVSYKN